MEQVHLGVACPGIVACGVVCNRCVATEVLHLMINQIILYGYSALCNNVWLKEQSSTV